MTLLGGQVAIITGAASGIGRAFASTFAAQGAAVALCDVHAGVEDVARKICEQGGCAASWHVDVREAEQVRQFVSDATERFGGLDIVVANAGAWRPTSVADPWDKALEDWDLMVNTNTRGVFLLGRASIPHLIRRGRGHIINIATDHICPPPRCATGGGRSMDVYDCSKWGLNGLTQSWAKALRARAIRVNAICMDATDTELMRRAVGKTMTPEMVDRWIKPQQIAELALDLIREGDQGRTGENIGVWVGHEVKLPPRATELPSRLP